MSASPRAVPIGLVVNATARAARRHVRDRNHFWLDVVPDEFVRVTENLEQLDAAIAAFQHAGVRAVAVLGGDGSAHHLLDAILRHYEEGDAPIVLLLAGGTMNGVPRALGTGGPPGKVLRWAAGMLGSVTPPTRTQHVLRLVELDRGRVLHGFGMATGVVYRAYEHYYRHGNGGLVSAVRASLLPIWAGLSGGTFYGGVQLDVRTEDGPWLPDPPHTLVASVLDAPLLWFRPFGAPLGDAAAFHLAATSMAPRQIAPRLWSIFRGRCRHPRLRIGQAQEARISVRGDVGYLLDGDLYPSRAGSLEVNVIVGPRLRFLVREGAPRAGGRDPRPDPPVPGR